jgi:histidine triad (HIT) family protein|tara:strand:- start:7768 stop:8181 length:414 start_codon:yes stop_codon:yes gene_type:complete
MNEDCIFCRILEGELPSHKVYEDQWAMAFMDTSPVSDGHVLVITRTHYEDIFEATPESLAAISGVVAKIAKAIKVVLNPDGLTVAQLNGAAAGQTVIHYHTHLIPRRDGDPMDLHARGQAEPDALAELAQQISGALD